jgi:hypothetical protein
MLYKYTFDLVRDEDNRVVVSGLASMSEAILEKSLREDGYFLRVVCRREIV